VRKSTQTLIRWLLGIVLVADIALAAVNWKMAAAPRDPAEELHTLRQQRALLAADIQRAKTIRAELGGVERDGTAFFQSQIAPAQSGYSALSQNLGDLAKTAGVRTSNITYRAGNADKRGVMEVEIGASISGDYPNIVRFINGLEHSDTFYILDSLTLGAGSAGGLGLNLHLRTFFRS
jgi:type II secretion system (T2SS) protein M